MSRTIDERVVSMEFDNRHFERNVKTSLSTLDKLKKSLKLEGATKGLEDVNNAAKRCNLAPISNAVESVGLKFNAMYTIADTVFRRITNAAITTGRNITRAFTVDPIKTGLQEYETQINAVQTILANTESKGTTLNDVNSALDELNRYADKTIYNFTEMTRNIGTFTAAGVDLDKSVKSIQGIANLAAVSGSTSQQASTAMYQLSQALAAGRVTLMDWNSVVNAGMGGQVFQDALKRTAKTMGKDVDGAIKKYGSFRESLTQGEWLTTDVLTKTLEQFTMAAEEGTEQWNKYKQSLMSDGYTEAQANEILKLANTATNAATKVKTFTQLMDTLKEAAQSGWTQTWELIIGDFEEAKELWTGISEVFGGIINESAESRNAVLEGALTSKWEKMTKKINEAGIETSTFEERVKAVAKEHGVNIDGLIKKHGSLEEVFRSGAVSTKYLTEAVDGLSGSLVDLSGIEDELKKGSKGDDVKKVQQVLKDLGYDLGKWGVDGIIGSQTESAIKKFQEAQGLEITGIIDEKTIAALEKATGGVEGLNAAVKDLISGVTELGGREMLIESVKNAWSGLTQVLGIVKDVWKEVFGEMTTEEKSERLFGIIEGIHKFSEELKELDPETVDKIRRTFKGLFSVLEVIATLTGGGLKAGFKLLCRALGMVDVNILDLTASVGDALVKFRDWAFESGSLAKAGEQIITWLVNGAKAAYEWIQAFVKLPVVQTNLDRFRKAFSDTFSQLGEFFGGGWDKVKEFIDNLKSMDSISFDNIVEVFGKFKDDIVEYFVTKGGNIFDSMRNALKKFKEDAKKYLEAAGIKFDDIKTTVIDFVDAIKTKLGEHAGSIIAVGLLAGLLFILNKIKKAIETISNPLEAFSGLFENLGKVMKAVALKVKSEALVNLAKSILIMVGALVLLTLIDPTKLGIALGVITVLLAELVGVAFILGKINIKDFGKMAVQILAITGALTLMAISVRMLGSMDPKQLLLGAGVLSAFMLALVLMGKVISKSQGALVNMMAFGAMAVEIGKALLILSLAVLILGKMDRDALIQGGIAVAGFLVIMAGVMAATNVIAKDMPKFAGTMAGLSASLLILSVAVGIFGHMDADTLLKGGTAIAVFLGMMVGMMAATKLLAKDMPKFGAAMFGISTGILALAVAIKVLARMDGEEIVKGGLVIAAMMGLMVGLMAATKLLGKYSGNAAKMGVMMLAFSGAVLVMTGAIAVLGMLPEDAINKALGAIAKLALIFGMLMVLTEFADEVKGIIAMSAAIAIIAASVAALTFIDQEKLQSATTCMVAIMGMFAIVVASTHFVQKSIGTLLVMTGAVVILAGVLYLLKDLPVENTLATTASLAALILSLSVACALLSVVPIMGALTAVANLAILIAGLILVLAAVGGIAQIPGVDWLISEGGSFLQTVGTAIGNFVGGIVGGFASGMSASLPEIATNLSTFTEKLSPFITAVADIDESSMTGVSMLADMLLTLTAASILDAIANWITGGSSLQTFAGQLVPFGESMAKFSATVDGKINATAVEAAANAGKMMAEMADTIPNSGGVVGFFAGENDMAAFGAQLVPFGTSMAAFSAAVDGKINATAVEAAANAGTMMAKMANTIPNTGGLVAFFAGDNDMATFGEQLVPFGESLAEFSTKVTDIDAEAVTAAASAGESLAKMANSLPETGGIWTIFTGDNDMKTFGEQLKTFGGGIASFSNEVTGINIDAVKTAADAGNVMATMASKVNGSTLGFYLAEFGGAMSAFGGHLEEYYASISGINTYKLSSVTAQLSTLIGVANGTVGVDFAGLGSFGESLGKIGGDGVKKFIQAFADAKKKVHDIGGEMLMTLIKGVNSRKESVKVGFKILAVSMAEAITSKYHAFYDAGKYLVKGFSNGISGNTFLAVAKAKAMANAAEEAAKEALDINSPSKVFMGIGGSVPEGFAKGIDKLSGMVNRSTTDMADSAINGTKSAIARIADTINSDVDNQPTIRPVLDLSEIASGAGAINGMFGMTPSVGLLANVGSISASMNNRQNGTNADVISAIDNLGKKMGKGTGDTYNFGGITYDNGSEISDAVRVLVRAAKVERRK